MTIKNALLSTAFLSVLCCNSVCAQTDESITNLATEDYSGKADSLEYCFVKNFLVEDKGVFKVNPTDSGPQWDIYWQQAHAMDVLVYAYERIKDTNPELAETYKTYFSRWHSNHANNWGKAGSWENPFTDDMCWIGLTLTHMYEAVGRPYMTSAKSIYDNYIAKRKQTDSRGTFLPWNSYGESNSGPNACTLAPACLLALRLYNQYGKENYLEDAKAYYQFMVDNICFDDGRVEDPPLTYTQGTFAEACRLLYHITGESEYMAKAQKYIRYASTSGRCLGNGLLRHEGTSMDQSLFKAVYIPYAVNYVLDDVFTSRYRKNMVSFLLKNADALWENLDKNAYPKMYCTWYWGDKYNAADKNYGTSMGAMASGASLLENVARMNLALQAIAAANGIETVEAEVEPESDAVYNIAGQKVGAGYKGIIILNGRKYINK